MKIFGMADGPATGLIRLSIPLNSLTALGHEVSAGYRPDEMPDECDVWIGQRVSGIGVSDVWRTMAKLDSRHAFMVFELDDDIWNVPQWSGVYSVWSEPDRLERVRQNIQAADRVIVSTEYLAQRVREETGHRDIVVHPNTLPRAVFEHPDVRRTDGVVTLGWAGSSTHARDFDVCAPAVKTMLGPGVELKTIGHNYPEEAGGAATVRYGEREIELGGTTFASVRQWCRHRPWYRAPWKYWEALDFHIGLLPLERAPFNLSKSNIKALEYGARGIPAVATPWGPYARYITHMQNGMVARNEHEWVRSLASLIYDRDMREAMGQRARSCARRYVSEEWAERYEHAVMPR